MSQKQSLKGWQEHSGRAQWLLWFGNQWTRCIDFLGTPTHMHSQASSHRQDRFPELWYIPATNTTHHGLTGHSDPVQHSRGGSREWWFFTQEELRATRSCHLQQVRLGDGELNSQRWIISFSTGMPKNLETRQVSQLLPVTCSSSS